MGYALTVVPVGSAPPGTVIELLVLDVARVMVVGVVAETVPETGVPRDDTVTSLGGGAFTGPIDVVSNEAAALGDELW
jgi:hypothetical protein